MQVSGLDFARRLSVIKTGVFGRSRFCATVASSRARVASSGFGEATGYAQRGARYSRQASTTETQLTLRQAAVSPCDLFIKWAPSV